ncbi:MAG: sortase [Actinotalea sp.]|nr:sortase [Actinotalea sp.]
MSTPRPRRTPHRALRTAAATALGALVLAGCADGSADEPAGAAPPEVVATAEPTGEPAAEPTPARPAVEVPVRRADLSSFEVESVVQPVGVAVPSIDVAIPVEPVGVQDDGQMEIPPLAEVGGWYRYGASPAQESGTSVIAAHVDSIATGGTGPFARLRDVAVGDPVEVTLEDGTTQTFSVVEVRRVPKPTVEWEDVFVRQGGKRLVLITCGGTFDRGAQSYSDNVIVTAEPRV